MARYLIRLDDACPAMHQENWTRMEELLDRFGVSPIVAVVPENQDPKLQFDDPDPAFWDRVREWAGRGWAVAMHGYQHHYETEHGGMLGIGTKSEFAGLPAEIQREKIRKGWNLITAQGIHPTTWVAPSHTFDRTTLNILSEETSISTISDGIALRPYLDYGFLWIPQQFWRPRSMPFGVWTICYHPSTMAASDFTGLERFLTENHSSVARIEDFATVRRGIGPFDRIFRKLYYRSFEKRLQP
ncbi:MAG: DUF2334 domain-containing protein [Spirochaetales bacterium]|nr:DUF2334 domain-containing protein [Spirochaetales bacterium]MCF7937743.1 DUF2334 domain-containing protein [Spirochaetales bacterium]